MFSLADGEKLQKSKQINKQWLLSALLEMRWRIQIVWKMDEICTASKCVSAYPLSPSVSLFLACSGFFLTTLTVSLCNFTFPQWMWVWAKSGCVFVQFQFEYISRDYVNLCHRKCCRIWSAFKGRLELWLMTLTQPNQQPFSLTFPRTLATLHFDRTFCVRASTFRRNGTANHQSEQVLGSFFLSLVVAIESPKRCCEQSIHLHFGFSHCSKQY